MKRAFWPSMSVVASLLMAQACSHAPRPQEAVWVEPAAGAISLHRAEHVVLAGEWEYEEGGMVVPLKLDRFGNGSYDFKDGRFRTDLLSEHRWAGAWAQQENDREGGFEITLSPDFSEGDGRWWYTRIEQDHAPVQAGGRFHVVKVQSMAEHLPLPAAQSPH